MNIVGHFVPPCYGAFPGLANPYPHPYPRYSDFPPRLTFQEIVYGLDSCWIFNFILVFYLMNNLLIFVYVFLSTI